MPDLIIKPEDTVGNKLIIQDQAGGAVLTTADSGSTLTNTSIDSSCTLPSSDSGKILQVVQVETTAQGYRSSASWGGVSPNFSKSITITEGNKILISTTMHLSIKGTTELKIRLYDNTLSSYIGTEGLDGLFGCHVHDDSQWNNVSYTYLYTPASGTLHNIEPHFISNGSNNVTMNNRAYGDNAYGRVSSCMVLLEVAA